MEDDEKFCSHCLNYTNDSEEEKGSSEHINFRTNKGNSFERITNTGRWKKSEYGSDEVGLTSAKAWTVSSYLNDNGNVTKNISWKNWSTVSDSDNLEKLYQEYLNFLANKYPDEKDPINYYNG